MTLEEYISLLRPEVEKLFMKDSSGHDTSHLERVMRLALYIQTKEGGDKLVIGVSAYLHDIHRILQNEKGAYCTPKESLPIIRKLLKKAKFPEEKIPEVLHCIECHEEYNWNNPENRNSDIETLILQDADNLDAIGAIGIARTFAYGGSHNRPVYNPASPINKNCDYSEETGLEDPSTIHHFYHKLLKLAEHMNTETAKKIAEQRSSFMRKFLDIFLKEWDGEY